MNTYEYSLRAVGFLPGECLDGREHTPILNDVDRIRCANCNITGPIAVEWDNAIRHEVRVEAAVQAVG